MSADLEGHEFPVITLVDKLLLDAIAMGASDIHLEPGKEGMRIRFRKDGILHITGSHPAHLGVRMVSRIKIMSGLDIAEKRIPQDGRYRFTHTDGFHTDFRVSTCPLLDGEKVVLRVLEKEAATRPLHTLGMPEAQCAQLLHALERPQGMVLVTGPTGSGKTVTLYAALRHLNTPDRNIATVEDPVEIALPGVNQVHVNPGAGLTFATALRAFLRQDPDIIMVGEIRDEETAAIAVKAAHTGHLVLSTLHTNSTTETLMRLQHMGVAAWHITSAISLIVAQRLVRVLCDNCKVPTEHGFRATGCTACYQGYRGRTGIFEMLPLSSGLREQLLAGASPDTLRATARKAGVRTLHERGTDLVRAGIVSIEELRRVCSGEDHDVR